jgi:hypothetical protein
MAARGSRPIWVACALLVLLLAAAAPADAKSKKKSKKSSKPTSAFGGRDRHAKISKASLALFNAIEDAKPDEARAAGTIQPPAQPDTTEDGGRGVGFRCAR